MITIYSTPTCVFCNAAKQYLKSQDIKFTDIDVSKDMQAATKMVEISGQMGVPVIDVDGEVVVGFYKPQLETVLKQKNILTA